MAKFPRKNPPVVALCVGFRKIDYGYTFRKSLIEKGGKILSFVQSIKEVNNFVAATCMSTHSNGKHYQVEIEVSYSI